MSSFERSSSSGRSDDPLNEREIAQLTRLLTDPFAIPPEFWNAIKLHLENDPPELTWDNIIGFNAAAVAAAPAFTEVKLAVTVSALLTDLVGPKGYVHSYWQINPGGGSLRSIGEPAYVGARITLKNDFVGNTTIRHYDTTAAPPGRPLFLLGAADVILPTSAAMEVVYDGATWHEVTRLSPGGAWVSGDTKTSAQAATHAAAGGGTWYLADGSAIPAGETALIALLGANLPDARGRGLVIKGTHVDVDAVGDNDGIALVNRRPKHNTTLVDPGHVHLSYDGALFQAYDGANATGRNYPSGTADTGSKVTGITADAAGGAGHPADQSAYVVAGNLFYHS